MGSERGVSVSVPAATVTPGGGGEYTALPHPSPQWRRVPKLLGVSADVKGDFQRVQSFLGLGDGRQGEGEFAHHLFVFHRL